MTPTSWLFLGAAAVLSLGVWGITVSSAHVGMIGAAPFALLLALSLWGLAGWSLLLALTMTLRVWILGQLHFSLVWWAFVFPMSAYVLDSRTMAAASHASWLYQFSDGLLVLLFLFFLIVAVKTVMGLITGRLFRQA